MIATDRLTDIFTEKVTRIFGADDDPMLLVEQRARQLLPDHRPIVWEGDAQTFQFSFVGEAAEQVLGHAASRWIAEPTFWPIRSFIPTIGTTRSPSAPSRPGKAPTTTSSTAPSVPTAASSGCTTS